MPGQGSSRNRSVGGPSVCVGACARMAERDGLIEKLEKKVQQRTYVESLFTIR